MNYYFIRCTGSARGEAVIIVGKGQRDPSLNHGPTCLRFTFAVMPWGKFCIHLFSLQFCVNNRTDWNLHLLRQPVKKKKNFEFKTAALR